MPQVTFYFAAERQPPGPVMDALSAQCAQLCVDVLRAEPGNVHITHVGVHHGWGLPVRVDITHRISPHRTPAVMALFMARLDESVQRLTTLQARIRCFGYAPEHIQACH